MLWDLLTVLSGASAYSGAWTALRVTGVKGAALVVGVVLGLGIGVACIITIRVASGQALDRISHTGEGAESRTERALRLVYFGAIVWLVISEVLAYQITKVVIRLAMSWQS
jgi:hypothetical protein